MNVAAQALSRFLKQGWHLDGAIAPFKSQDFGETSILAYKLLLVPSIWSLNAMLATKKWNENIKC